MEVLKFDRRRFYLKEIFKLFTFSFVTAWICYRSRLGIIVTLPAGGILFFTDYQKECARTKERILSSFKDAMLLLAGAMRAGYSLEQGLIRVTGDYARMHGKDVMEAELRRMVHGLSLKRPVEDLFFDLARRTGLSEIESLSENISLARRYGGSISSMIALTADELSEKARTALEVRTVMAAKRLEGRMMTAVPAVVMLYLWLTNESYVRVLYEGIAGRAIMTLVFAVNMACFFWMEQISKEGQM